MKESFSNRLNAALVMREMKQSDLVEKTSLGKSAISQYCSGKYEPKQQAIYKLAEALNVSEGWLMGFDVPIERQNYEIKTIAAHHDGNDWTTEELKEIEKFKQYVRMKRSIK